MLFTLAFLRLHYLKLLNLTTCHNSPDRSTKSTPSHIYSAPTACKHRVSGSLSLPSRGPFHLSFTVLCAIGHWWYFILQVVSARSHKVSRVSWYSGYCHVGFDFGYAAFTLSCRTSQTVLLSIPNQLCSPNPAG